MFANPISNKAGAPATLHRITSLHPDMPATLSCSFHPLTRRHTPPPIMAMRNKEHEHG